MNIQFLGTLGVFMILIVVGLFIFLMRRIYGKRDFSSNEDIIINGLSDYCSGHALGIKKKEERNGEMRKITISPRDINYIELDKNKGYRVEEQDIFVKKELLVPIGLSTHRNIYWALPNHGKDLPNEFKKHPFGQLVMKYIEKVNSKEDEIKILEKKNASQNEILKKIASNEPLAKFEEMMSNISKDALNIVAQDNLKFNNKKLDKNKEK